MAGRKSWLIAVALCAPVAVVVATCGWAFVRGRPAAFGCTPPAGEEALIAQYRVDPLLQPDTFPAPGTPQPPIIRRYCDNVGAVYAATSLGWVYALDAGTGRTLWTTMVPVGRNYTYEWSGAASAPTVGGGGIFLGGADGDVYALDAATGAARWRTAVGGADGGVGSVPAFADGRVVVATADGRIAALDSGTGAVHWQRTVAGKIPGSPHLVDGHIFVSVLANSYPDVYALDRPPVRSNGSTRQSAWSATTSGR